MTAILSNPAGAAKEAAERYTRALLELLGDRVLSGHDLVHLRRIARIKSVIGAA